MADLASIRARWADLVAGAPEIHVTKPEPEPVDPAYLELLGHLQGLVGEVLVLKMWRAGGRMETVLTVSGTLGRGKSFDDGTTAFELLSGTLQVCRFALSPRDFHVGSVEIVAGVPVVTWFADGLGFSLAGQPRREV